MPKLGHDFGSVPFGIHQIAARLRRRCTCRPLLFGIAAAIDCPEHGLYAYLRRLLCERPANG